MTNLKRLLKKILPHRIKLFISNILGRFNEREYYNENDKIAEGTTASSHVKIAQIFLKKLKRGDHVLDLGCGSGYMANQAAKIGCKVVGVDYSKKALKYAEKYNSGPVENSITYLHQDIQKGLNFDSDFFDVVIIEEVLEHLSNPREVLLNASKVLKKGGLLLVSVPYDAEPSGYHISPMNEKTIPIIFRNLNPKIDRPFLPWGTTHIIEINK
ncbi:MAG: methyltransferase domain-containing protein [bacterium]